MRMRRVGGGCVSFNPPFRGRPRPAIKATVADAVGFPKESMISTILIIGGGQAGAQAIDTLRRKGFAAVWC